MTSNSALRNLLTAGLLAVSGLGIATAVGAQQSVPATAPAGVAMGGAGGVHSSETAGPAVARAPEAALSTGAHDAGVVAQGLKMHGHWTIDIKNPDGTLAHHHEFENSILYDGANYLVGLISGYASAGSWYVYFTSPSGGTSPCTSGRYPFCAIVYSATTIPGNFACQNYTCVSGLTITPSFGTSPSLTLAGSITAQNAGTIGSVYTAQAGCGGPSNPTYPTSISTVSPATCYASNGANAFGGSATGTNITPISVASGQIIQVSVVLSFS